MKKLFSILLVLLLVAGLFPANAPAQSEEGFTINVEKITNDPDYLIFKVSSETPFIRLYMAFLKETAYESIKNEIVEYLTNNQFIDGQISKGTASFGGDEITSTEVYRSKYYLENYFENDSDKLYFLCLAEDKNGNLSEYEVIEITKSDVDVNEENYKNVEDALRIINERISGKEEETLNLINILKNIDKNDVIIGTLFDNLNETLKQRLNNSNINKETVSEAYQIFYRNAGYSYLEDIIEFKAEYPDFGIQEDRDFVTWAKSTFNEIFKDENAPLKEFYDKIIDKFGTFRDFLSYIKQNENIAAANLTVVYNNGRISIKENENSQLSSKINEKLAEKGIAGISPDDIANIIAATNKVLENFTGDDALAMAEYLKAQGYNVIGLPSEEPGTPGGDTGGGGGGGAATPSEPEIEVPQDKTKPVAVVVPSDAVEVKVVNGKVTVTFDEKLVENLLKLIDEALAKADGREVVLSIDLSGNDKVAEGATVELPVNVVAKAFEKGVAMTVNFKALGIDIPTGTFDAKDVKTLKLVVEKKNTSDVVKNLKGIEKMRPIGTAFDLSMLADEKPVSFKKKVTLRFSIKGLTTNIDKLGVYYIDENEGKLEFVGGKVDKTKAEIKAKLSHLSTYALFEYEKTFTDIANHWARTYIESMAAKHVVHGRTEQKFVPNDGITRAEFAKLMVTALELDLVPYKGSFEDVKSGTWYADYIQTAYENGIITGRIEGKVFDPNARITRQEIMAMVGRALAKKPVRPVDALLASFKDAAKVAGYAKEHAALLVELGIVSGYPDGTLKPEANTTRAEAVKLIYGLYNNY